MAISLDDLATNAELRERLGAVCDFNVGRGRGGPPWFTVDGAGDVAVIAHDGGGGAFAVMPPSPRVLYASSEGLAGIVASDVPALLTLVVLCPYWRDVLKYSGMGRLEEMRRAAPVLEAVWLEDDEEHGEAREFLKDELDIVAPDDLIGALHRMVSSSDVVVRAALDGNPAEPLFGRFTIDDNPMLKALAD